MRKELSVVIPTLGRKEELKQLLYSITKTQYPINEVIVVDQNCNSLIDEIITEFNSRLTIIHLKVNFKGASRARNYGSTKVTGEYICFPDDDAEFFSDTIVRALEIVANKHVSVLFGKCIDHDKNDSVSNFVDKDGYLSLKKHEGMFVESTLFIDTNLFKEYLFDENLGVGTFHGAEEGYDLVLRLLKDKISIYYSPSILFYHPSKVMNHISENEIRRVFTYRCGFASLCRKHKLKKKWLTRFFKVSVLIPYLFLFDFKKSRYYIAEWLGLLTGLIVR